MGFSLKDIRLTTRRSDDGLTIHPRLLRERAILPKIEFAAQYFESLLGHERRELDPEVLVHFFGDHKLARCLVACLARSYRFRAPLLSEVVSATVLRRLQRAGIEAPRDLRYLLFDRVNAESDGYLPTARREELLATLERQLSLRRGDLERLLWLDAEEHAILTGLGAEPRPEDVVAQYNFGVLEGLLRHLEYVDLTIQGADRQAAADLRALCLAADVDAECIQESGRLLVRLLGRQDALGVWARHGRKVARVLVQLLARVRPALADASARIALKGRSGTLRLSPELLEVLVGRSTPALDGDGDDWPVHTSLLDIIGAGRSDGGAWSVRRWPEMQAWHAGVVVPDLLVRTRDGGLLLCSVRSEAHAASLAPIAELATTGEPLVFVGVPRSIGPLSAVGARVIGLPEPDGRALRAAVSSLVSSLELSHRLRTAA